MEITDLLRELGGVARRAALLTVVDRVDLERAVAAGDVVRDARGRYSLPDTDAGLRAAQACGGALCLASAAIHHGWAVKVVPTRPQVMISRGRRLPVAPAVQVHYAELGAADVDRGVTVEAATLGHCLRRLPFDEALAIADSALREGFGRSNLQRIAETMTGPGARQARRVAREATALAANPFESVLRAIALDVPGLRVRPQVRITDGAWPVEPDLVDESLRLVLEADSFEWHGGRDALAEDARRYNMLVVAGWLVLRFSYEDVMGDPESVRCTLQSAVALAELLKDRAA